MTDNSIFQASEQSISPLTIKLGPNYYINDEHVFNVRKSTQRTLLGLQNQFNIVNNFLIFSPKQFHYHPHALVYYIIEESRPNRRNFLINDVFIYFLYRDLPQYIYGIISTILNFQNF